MELVFQIFGAVREYFAAPAAPSFANSGQQKLGKVSDISNLVYLPPLNILLQISRAILRLFRRPGGAILCPRRQRMQNAA